MAQTPAAAALIQALGLDPAEVTNLSLQIVEGRDPVVRVHQRVTRVTQVVDALTSLKITETGGR